MFATCGCPSFPLCPTPFLPRDRKQREGSQGNIKQGLLLWIMSTKKTSRLRFYDLHYFENPVRGPRTGPSLHTGHCPSTHLETSLHPHDHPPGGCYDQHPRIRDEAPSPEMSFHFPQSRLEGQRPKMWLSQPIHKGDRIIPSFKTLPLSEDKCPQTG